MADDDRPCQRDVRQLRERSMNERQLKDRSKPRRMNMRGMMGRSMSLHPPSGRRRRISPATMEATRIALAARAEYSREARDCKPLEKVAFLIVTKDGVEKLDELEMALFSIDHNRKQQIGSDSSRTNEQRSATKTQEDSTHDDDDLQRAAVGKHSDGVQSVNQQVKSPRIRLKSLRGDNLGSSPSTRCSEGRKGHQSMPLSTEADPSSLLGSSPNDRLSTEKISLTKERTEVRAEAIALRDIFSSSSNRWQRAPRPLVAWQETPSEDEDVTSPGGSRRSEQHRGLRNESSASIVRTASSSSRVYYVLRLAAAGAIMLTGSCAFIGSYVIGRREGWAVLGSTVMGLGCLLLVIGVCCYLANTHNRSHTGGAVGGRGGGGGGRSAEGVEIRVVDQRQLDKFMKMGVHVETLTI